MARRQKVQKHPTNRHPSSRGDQPSAALLKIREKCASTKVTALMDNTSKRHTIFWHPASTLDIETLLHSSGKPGPSPRSSPKGKSKRRSLRQVPTPTPSQYPQIDDHLNLNVGELLDHYLKLDVTSIVGQQEIKTEMDKADVEICSATLEEVSMQGRITTHRDVVDKITRDIFRAYMRDTIQRGYPNMGLRDALIVNLEMRNGVSTEELANMFQLSKWKVKEILKHIGGALTPTGKTTLVALEEAKRSARIQSFIRAKISSHIGLITSSTLISEIRGELGYDLSKYQITKILKHDLGMLWKNVHSQDQYVNTEKNIELRKEFAYQILGIMEERKILLNFDESQIDASNWRRMSWVNQTGPRARKCQRRFSGLSLLLAVSNVGDLYFKFLKGPNNECTVAQFFIELEQALSNQLPSWRETHVLVLDNCPSHKTPLVREVLGKLGYDVMFSAPASYLIMPVEGVFGALKATNFLSMEEPALPGMKELRFTKLTHMQKCVLNVSNYLFNLKANSIKNIFKRALSQIPRFLMKERV